MPVSVDILLTNESSQALTLVSAEVVKGNTVTPLPLPQLLSGNSTAGGYGTDASPDPYKAVWTYTPDGGATSLSFVYDVSGERGITIAPSKSGPLADQWVLAESPSWNGVGYLIRFYYAQGALRGV